MSFFSIIIPTYNRKNLLVEAVKSIINQSYQNFEIIIVDDGSTDDTHAAILLEFKNDERVNYYWKINEERGAARNFGISKSLGKYLIFFDSDDFMHSDHLETLYNFVSHNPEYKLIATKHDFLRNGKSQVATELANLPESEYSADLFLRGNFLACHFCVKNTKESIGLFETDRKYAIMEDWIFLVQNTLKNKIYIIDKVTITMNDHDDRSMRSDNGIIIYKRLLATTYIIDNFNLNKKQINILNSYSFYFCAVHSYIDGNARKGLKYLFRAVAIEGFNSKFLELFLKIIVGKSLISKFR